ncbi:MAG: hypothetical protein EOP39_18825 [Rubrivivax sp.]|nr:MAG: hypothetical protein EOP39_18825 [Rubrivivax sp.]
MEAVVPARSRVLVIGGYGFFGRRLVTRLARWDGLHLVVAGRSLSSGTALVDGLRPASRSALDAVTLDVQAPTLARDIERLNPDVVVHASGPFQGQDYRVAMAALASGAHCIDLADGRDFVTGIVALHTEAKRAGRAVISGASSVPALSSAACDHLARHFREVIRIDIGISPGNRTERGLSTVQAILSYCGRPLPAAGRSFGWSGSWRHVYPSPVGARLLSPCDVPDLDLLPCRYAGQPEVRFGAGLELPLLHRGMNAMALLTRLGIVIDWARHAVPLKWVADRFKTWGSDAGAMHVAVTGTALDGRTTTRRWDLVAIGGDGPFVPTLAAAALTRKLLRGEHALVGARPCVGLLSLDDFARETDGLRISTMLTP